MNDQEPDDEAYWNEITAEKAFAAKFKPGDFARVAQALDLPEDPETLVRLRDMLLPEFRFFVGIGPGQKVSRDDRIDRLEKLREAAAALDGLLGPGGVRSSLPRKFWGSDLITDQFTDTLRMLALEAERGMRRLRSSPGQGGRPRKDEARQLGKDLIRVYQKIMGKRANELDFKRFYRFAAAVFRCARICLPAISGKIPPTPRALRDLLNAVWTFQVTRKTKNPSRSRSNYSAQ